MYRHDDCMCNPKKEYARAYILPQKYENLYSCKEGFSKGTIFKDLYKPDPYYSYYDYGYSYAYDYTNMNSEG
ncbi:spore coat associated protein CotJA [Clostridium sp.]|uniref:spore coat associated protein CotJA n=1 Tax=Clostridium sp. TaxID=1506 RepID=UPI00262C95C3|nr:spore coat associated protein CotJA [Clostridium sp.]